MKETIQPIRVAHIVGKWVGGGVEAVIMNYYRKINKNKIQFDFIIDRDSTLCPPIAEIEKMGGRIIEISPYQDMIQYSKDLKKIFLDGNYKIVHSHINTLSVFPLRIAKKCGVPFRIAHSHSTTNKKEWKKNILKEILKAFSKKYATNYFACSEYAGRWLFGNKTFENGKVTVINNAIDIDKFKYNEVIRNKIRKELNIENKFVVGNVGRFVKQKNHDFLIDIFNCIYKENEESILLLIGDGPLNNEIKEKVKKLGLDKQVKIMGIKENVNEYMQAMDIFLFPSLYEGLGIVVIEAQCSGLPCVVSDKVPEVVKILENVVFEKLNQDIEVWKKDVMNNLERKNKEFEKIVKSDFYINNEVKKIEKIYLKMGCV